MSTTPYQLTKCTATTAKGKPCRAWAIRGSDPPRCAPHAGLTGPPQGNQNALTHGFYSKQVPPHDLLALYDFADTVGINQEVVLLRVALHRLAGFINDPQVSFDDLKSIIPLLVTTTRALAYLTRQIPESAPLDWADALDELADDWGWDL